MPITHGCASTSSDAGRCTIPKRCNSPSVATVAYKFSPEENPAPSARLNVWIGFTSKHHTRNFARSLHNGGEHFLHQKMRATSGGGFKLPPAVGPNRMGNAPARCQPFVIALLIAIVNGRAGEQAIAIVLVRTDGAYAHVRRTKRDAAVHRLRKKRVSHEAQTRRVTARVVEGQIHVVKFRIVDPRAVTPFGKAATF